MNEDLKLGSVIWPNFSSPFNISCYGLNYECNILALGSSEGNIVLFRVEKNEKHKNGNEADIASNESVNKISSTDLGKTNNDSNCEEVKKSSNSNSFNKRIENDEDENEKINNRIKLIPYNILLNNKNNGCNNSVTQLCFGLSYSYLIQCVSKEILISLYVDNTIALWSLDEGRCFKIFKNYNFYIYNMKVLQDRRFILLSGYKDILVIDLWANTDKEIVARLSIENKECNEEGNKSNELSDVEDSNDTHYDIANSDINCKMFSSSSDSLESNNFSMDNYKENNERCKEVINEVYEEKSVKYFSPSLVNNINERDRYSKHNYYYNSQFLNYKLYYAKKKTTTTNSSNNNNNSNNSNLKICCISAGLVPYLKKENQRSLIQCMKLLKRKFFNIYEKREKNNSNSRNVGDNDNNNNNMQGEECDEEYIKLREKETYKNLHDLFYCPVLISAWLNNGDIICWDLTNLLNFYKSKTRFVIRTDKTEIEMYNETIEDIAENCIYDELIKNKINIPNDINLKSQDKHLKNTEDTYEQIDGVYHVNPIFISNLPSSKSDLEISGNGNSSQIGIIDNYIIILQKNRLIIYERKNANSSFVPLMDLFCPDFDQSCKRRTQNAHWVGMQVLRKPIWRFSSGASQSNSSKIRSFNIMQNMSKNICGCIIAWTTEGNFYCYTLPLKFSSMFLSFQSNIKSFFLMKVDKNLLGSFKSPGPILFYRNKYSTSKKDADTYEHNFSNSSSMFSQIRQNNNNENTNPAHLNNDYNNEEKTSNKYSSIYKVHTSSYSYSSINKNSLNEKSNLCEIEKNTCSIESTKLENSNSYNEDTNISKLKNNSNYRKNVNSKKKSSIWKDDVFFLFVNKLKLNRIIVYEYLFNIWYKTNKIDSIWLLGNKKKNNILEDNERGYKYDVIKREIETTKDYNMNIEKINNEEMYNTNIYNRKENVEYDENKNKEIITYTFCENNLNLYVIISYRESRVVCVLINCYKYVENKKIIYDLYIPDIIYKKKNFITVLHVENNYIIGGTNSGDILIWNVYNFSLVKFIKNCHFSYICSIYKVVTENFLKKDNVNISEEKEETSFVLTCDASNYMILINLNKIDYNNDHNNFFCKNDECNIILSSEDNMDSVLFLKKEKERLKKKMIKQKGSNNFEINICNKTDRINVRRISNSQIKYKNKKKRKSNSQINYVNTGFKRPSWINPENKYKLINILNCKNGIKNYQVKNNNSYIYSMSLLKAKKYIMKLRKKTWEKRYEMERKLKIMTHVCFHCCFKKLEKKNEINFKLINNVYINSYSSLLYISLVNNYVYIYNYKSGNFLRYLYDSQYSQISNIPFENVYTRLGISVSSIQLLNKIKIKKNKTTYLHEFNTESEIIFDDVSDKPSSCSYSLISSSPSLESLQHFLSSDGMEINRDNDTNTNDSYLSEKDGIDNKEIQFEKNKFNKMENIIRGKKEKKSYLLVKSQIPVISHILFRDNHLSKKALPLGRLLYHYFLPEKCTKLCKELFFFLTDFPSLPFSMCIQGKESTYSLIIPKYTQLFHFSKMYPLKLKRGKSRKKGNAENVEKNVEKNEDIINYRTYKKEMYKFLSAEKRKKKKKKKFFYDSLNIDYNDIYNKQFKNKYFLNDSLRKKYIYFGLKLGTKQNENKNKVSALMHKWKYVYESREENWNSENNRDILKKYKINKDSNLYPIKVNDKWELPNSSNSIYKDIEINCEKKTDKNYNRQNNNLYILQYNCSNNRNIERNKNIDKHKHRQWMCDYIDDEMDGWYSCDSSSSKSSIYLYIPKNKNNKHIGKTVRSSINRVSDIDKRIHISNRCSEIKGSKYNEGDIKKKIMNPINIFSKRENKKIKKKNKRDISYFFNDNSVEICCESLYVNTLYFCFILRFINFWFKMCRDKYNDNILINLKKYIIYNLPNNNKINLFLLSYISMYPYDKSIRIQLQKFMFILIQNMKNECLDKYSKLATEILRINNKKKRIIKKNNDSISLYDTTGAYIIQIIIPRVGSHYLYPYVYADEICLTLLLLLLVVKSIYLRNSKIFYSNASMATLIIHHICYYIFVDTQNLIENTYNKFNKFKLFHFIHLLSLSFSITWDFILLIQKGIFTNNMKNVTYSNFSINIKDEDFICNEQIINENFYKNLKDYYILANTLGNESLHHSSSEINLKNCIEDYIMKSNNDNNNSSSNMNEHHFEKQDLELSSYENVISDENSEIKTVVCKASESGECDSVIVNNVENEGNNNNINKFKIMEEQKKKIYGELCNINNDINKIFSNKKCPFNENNYISICHFILNIFELYTLSLNNISFLKILINIGRIEPFLFLKTLQYISNNLQKRVLYINKILFLLIILIKNYKWIFNYYMNIIIDILLISLDPSNNVRMLCLKLSTSLIYTLVKNFTICAFNKFTQRLAVANNSNKCIYLYDLKNAKKLKIFQGHKKSVNCINFNSTGTCLASYSKLDFSFKIWNCSNAGLFSGFLKVQSKCSRDIQLSKIKLSYLFLSDNFINITYKKKNEWVLRREDNVTYLIYT
ncbi:WD repeat-containing protein, putative [Plasmodium yoelii]|uniref:WD repeat-containing protein, putative n=1 Tax=Plasmodium yoelii TaxID=5861 RepID=A0A078K9U4_PLAYE|nr:WD repeat-containing protein, putative [Plasmodium yoelii]CDU19222.1 conserved Plasmodium protein, unknown function [Plasmodium yoelii]VTZ79857.1 WD repeat-containing protein, putative [Plasmodium yoelii]|eukprot:XP_022812562.1 WD repeat-containing protein, putative [Plasmodium yoelii]